MDGFTDVRGVHDAGLSQISDGLRYFEGAHIAAGRHTHLFGGFVQEHFGRRRQSNKLLYGVIVQRRVVFEWVLVAL